MVKLSGRNQIAGFRQVAERLASKMDSCEGVIGIVFLGGVVRGFADKFSDLDIIVFLGKIDEQLRRQVYEIGLNEEKRSKVDIDLEVHFLEDFKRWRWDENDRWDFSRAKIVFDHEGEIGKVFREKLRLPKDFWVRRIVLCAEYLKWYCCPPREEVGTIAEACMDRGDLVAAHYCLNYALDLLLRLVFALNKEFLPSPKWRVFYSYELEWLPRDYEKMLKEAIINTELSAQDFGRRLKAVRKLWPDTLHRIQEETGLTVDLISKYYVEKVLHQTSIP